MDYRDIKTVQNELSEAREMVKIYLEIGERDLVREEMEKVAALLEECDKIAWGDRYEEIREAVSRGIHGERKFTEPCGNEPWHISGSCECFGY